MIATNLILRIYFVKPRACNPRAGRQRQEDPRAGSLLVRLNWKAPNSMRDSISKKKKSD